MAPQKVEGGLKVPAEAPSVRTTRGNGRGRKSQVIQQEV